MRKLLLCAWLLLISQIATAQLQPAPKINSNKVLQLLKEREKNAKAAFETASMLRNETDDTAHYSHTTVKGTIYKLPQDNMPCLRPDTTMVYQMPIKPSSKRLLSSEGAVMPNAYTGKSLVWGQPIKD